jgi:1-acyl-sn-glycerol-3-phosphate acyltransferase
VRLAWSAILPQARRSLRASVNLVYGCYGTLLLGVMGMITWIGCALLPRPDWAWAWSRLVSRTFLWLLGMTPTVRGLENFPSGSCMIVVNHASYLDGAVLVAALREPRTFVAKGELQGHWVPRTFLKAMGAAYVDRMDVQRGVEDTKQFVELTRNGKSMLVFAEGTLRRMPGVLPFRMGAFVVAAQAGVPVVPVTLRGTRSALRDGQWLFHRSRLTVTVSPPIAPAGSDWNAAIALRDAARAEILRLSGEPDLSEETSLLTKPSAKTES